VKPQLVTIVWLLAAFVFSAVTTAQPPAGRDLPPSVAQFERTLVDVIARVKERLGIERVLLFRCHD
jgi:hypothetical protein